MTSYAERTRQPAHRSFFRERLARHARPVKPGQDAVHEYLIDQANLRGFFGAYSDRSNLGSLTPDLGLEEIVVGLLQPHAPAEPRVVKLVVRILQCEKLDASRLLFLARRERAEPVLAWIVALVPDVEQTPSLLGLRERLHRDPPRERRRPDIRYAPERLIRRPVSS